MTPKTSKQKAAGGDSSSTKSKDVSSSAPDGDSTSPQTSRQRATSRGETEKVITPLTHTRTSSGATNSSKKSDAETEELSSKKSSKKKTNMPRSGKDVMQVEEVVETDEVETPKAKEKEGKSSSRKKQKSAPKEEDSGPSVEQKSTKKGSSKKKTNGAEKDEAMEADEEKATVIETPKAPATEKEKKSSSKRKSKRSETTLCPNETLRVEQGPPTKPAPTVDVTVHRIRHLDYHPKPVLCIASTVSAKKESWMAVSRESGSIELQTVNPKLRTVATIAGSADTPMTVLAWTTVVSQQTTAHVLVGANRSDLYVVDFWKSGRLVARTPCAGGGVFCLQAIGGGDLVAAGCQDGSIRIFRVAAVAVDAAGGGSYQLQAVSTVPSAGSAVLSLACRPPKASKGTTGGMVGKVLFAGIADGTIRRYDCYPSQGTTSAAETTFFASAGVAWKSALRMTVECYGRSTATHVWALKAATDGTVVSGDSLGHVQFWDGDTGTLMSSFEQNDNKADVLALDMTADESKVFASGVDSRVVCIERSVTDGSDSSKWIMTHAQRPHTHDVKAVSIVKKFKIGPNGQVSKETEIMCTGGIDTKLCTYHVAEFGLRRPRALYPWPSLKSPIAAANKGRLLTMLREDRVDLYELASSPEEPKEMMTPVLVPAEDSLIGTVQVKGSSNLACSAVSSCGQFLALSDSYKLLLFHLQTESKSDGTRRAVPSKIPVKVPGTASIVAMRFVEDTCLILATSDNRLHVVSLAQSDELAMTVDGESGLQATIVQTLTSATKDTDERQASLLPVHSIFGTKDGSWFATARNSSSHRDGKIDVYRRNGADDDSYQFWWSLPSLGTSVSAAAFSENDGVPLLAVACVNYELYVFDVSERCLGRWSEKAGYPVTAKLPADLAARNDYPVRIGTNPAAPSVIMMGSFGAIVAVNTDEEFPQQCRIFPETHVRGTKRKRSQSVSEQRSGDCDQPAEKLSTCTMCLRYNSMLFMDFVGDHEMVVVEQPWLNVVATFPDALQRRVYGT